MFRQRLKRKLREVLITLVCSTGFVAPTHAAQILFSFVDTFTYYGNGLGLSSYISAADPSYNVTNVVLDVHDLSTMDLTVYDQIWVYDLVGGSNNNALQASNYSQIANWFDSSTHDLIVDGRIISSNFVGRTEPEWIGGYADALDARNGGLVLGTDHDYFVQGINEINALIGIDPFTDNFYQYPFEATVDDASPLATQNTPNGTHTCSNGINQCVWDHSSTSFVPTGQQTNPDIFLTPVAYHGHISPDDFSNAYDQAAIASTLGSITFGTCGGIDQPPCVIDVNEPGTLLLLAMGLFGLGYTRRHRYSA